jgi:uncharacterized protein YkwD
MALAAELSCVLDPLLSTVARDHARDLSGKGAKARSSDLDRLRFMVHKRGGLDYWLLPFFSPANDSGMAELSARLSRADLDRFGYCGLGLSNGPSPMTVLLLSDRVIELQPIPIEARPWQRFEVRGRVRPGARLSRAYLGLPGGSVRVVTPSVSQNGEFRFELVLSQPGRYELELSVDLGRGEETALLVPIFSGIAPDQRPTVVPDEDPNAPESPETLLGYINATRTRAGLSSLCLSQRLGTIAQRHSDEMVRERFFGHVSPNSGDLRSRLLAGGLSPAKYAENVARSRTLIRLHQNLKASPSHRMHLLDPEYTHVGIGISRSGEDLVVTEIFVASL